MSRQVKLKPCPFAWCKRRPRVQRQLTTPIVFWVYCPGKGHDVAGPIEESRDAAIRAWNERRTK